MSRGPMRLNAADPDFDARFDQLLSLKREADADVGADSVVDRINETFPGARLIDKPD